METCTCTATVELSVDAISREQGGDWTREAMQSLADLSFTRSGSYLRYVDCPILINASSLISSADILLASSPKIQFRPPFI